MSSLKRAITLSVTEKYSVFLIQFISSIIIARLLTPKEIGIFSIGSIVFALSHAVRDLGISNYLVQEKDLTRDHLQTAQTLMFASSWSLALIVWLISPLVAAFYEEPGIGEVLLVLILNFILLPFGAVSMALLRRDMHFGSLLRINFASSAVQAVTAITLCLLDFGFISLAWGGIAGTAVTVLGALLAAREPLPMRPRLPEWRRVLKVGGRFSGASVLWEVGLGSPEIIVGKMMTIEHAGYLSRAFGVVNLAYRTLMEGLAPVLMPFFAKESRAGADIGTQGCKAISLVSAITFPLFACLAIAMDAVVLLLYGSQWENSIAPARVLCLGMATLSLAVVGNSAVSGMSRSDFIFRIQLVGQPVKISLILLAGSLSLLHVAFAMVIGDALVTAYTLRVFISLTNTSLRSLLATLMPSLVVMLFAAVPCTVFKLSFPELSYWLLVPGCVCTAIFGWVLGLVLTKHELGKVLVRFFQI